MNKKTVWQVVFEFTSILFAVLLALGLNSFKSNIDLKNEARVLKKSILKECQENSIKIDSMLINNRDFYNYLDSLVSLPPDDVVGVSFSFDFEILTNAAWTMAQNNNAINQLDQDFLIQMAEIYQSQTFFTDFARSLFTSLGDYAMKQDDVTPYNAALSLYYNIHVMNSSLESLQEEYALLFEKELNKPNHQDE